jgi:alkyldihydroxyacetonephosphate synthase
MKSLFICATSVLALHRTGRLNDSENNINAQFRVSHSYGKSFRDILRGLEGRFDNPPDVFAYPHNEEQLLALMTFAESKRIVVVPYGGGTSVVGGVEPPKIEGTEYKGVVSVDMKHFNRLLDVDRVTNNHAIIMII